MTHPILKEGEMVGFCMIVYCQSFLIQATWDISDSYYYVYIDSQAGIFYSFKFNFKLKKVYEIT
jgi:hypothetical protein